VSAIPEVPRVVIALISVLTLTSVVLWAVGRRFLRRHIARYGTMPPSTWMFRRSEDPELERYRRFALGILPVYLIALVLFLLRP
jgi:hypothetical protein